MLKKTKTQRRKTFLCFRTGYVACPLNKRYISFCNKPQSIKIYLLRYFAMEEMTLTDGVQRRMSVENAEINILYTTAFAIYLLAQDAERRMNASGMSLGFRRKQLFNGIIS